MANGALYSLALSVSDWTTSAMASSSQGSAKWAVFPQNAGDEFAIVHLLFLSQLNQRINTARIPPYPPRDRNRWLTIPSPGHEH
jgi:hypothetical protein